MGTERAWFLLCLGLGRLLRAGKYSKARIVTQDGELQVRKHRAFYAPILVRLGDPLVKILDTGVRVLPQREWEERERLLYQTLYATSIHVDRNGVIVLPRLPGQTLATLLDEPQLQGPDRTKAIQLAALALARFHDAGFTHGDAMAENVMIDLQAGVAHWFDFETVHDVDRPMAWRRADDLRALIATSLRRTRRDAFGKTLDLILGAYPNEEVTRLLAASFTSVLRRPLALHLGQAALAFDEYREIASLLAERFAH
jgi:tRNA A-37 threonylcarbamoyl transferase component Bud32